MQRHFYLLWNTAIVGTLEIGFAITNGTVFRQFVTVITAIIFSVAEQPFRNATVIRLTRATLPTGCTITLSTHVGRFV